MDKAINKCPSGPHRDHAATGANRATESQESPLPYLQYKSLRSGIFLFPFAIHKSLISKPEDFQKDFGKARSTLDARGWKLRNEWKEFVEPTIRKVQKEQEWSCDLIKLIQGLPENSNLDMQKPKEEFDSLAKYLVRAYPNHQEIEYNKKLWRNLLKHVRRGYKEWVDLLELQLKEQRLLQEPQKMPGAGPDSVPVAAVVPRAEGTGSLAQLLSAQQETESTKDSSEKGDKGTKERAATLKDDLEGVKEKVLPQVIPPPGHQEEQGSQQGHKADQADSDSPGFNEVCNWLRGVLVGVHESILKEYAKRMVDYGLDSVAILEKDLYHLENEGYISLDVIKMKPVHCQLLRHKIETLFMTRLQNQDERAAKRAKLKECDDE